MEVNFLLNQLNGSDNIINLTTDQIKKLAESMLKKTHMVNDNFDDLPEYIRKHWISEAYKAEEHFNLVVKLLEQDGISVKLSFK